MDPPLNPAGAFEPEANYGPERRAELIAIVENAPALMRGAVAGLSEAQLDTKYRNWTVRQIVHHLADSHIHSYIRFKWSLTEDVPTIKPYDEGRWATLADSQTGDIAAPLALLDGLHLRWVQLMRAMTDDQFARSFFHPESRQRVVLSEALAYYAWHCRHHTAQVIWVRDHHGW